MKVVHYQQNEWSNPFGLIGKEKGRRHTDFACSLPLRAWGRRMVNSDGVGWYIHQASHDIDEVTCEACLFSNMKELK